MAHKRGTTGEPSGLQLNGVGSFSLTPCNDAGSSSLASPFECLGSSSLRPFLFSTSCSLGAPSRRTAVGCPMAFGLAIVGSFSPPFPGVYVKAK